MHQARQDWDPVVFNNKSDAKEKQDRSVTVSKKTVARTENGIKVSELESGEIMKLPKSSLSFRVELAKARNSRGWSQQALANQCNIGINLIKEWENGKGIPPTPLQVQTLSTKLGVKLPSALQKNK